MAAHPRTPAVSTDNTLPATTTELIGIDEQTLDHQLSQPAVAGKNSLTCAQLLEIFRLRRLNPDATMASIAKVIGCSTSSVSRWLSAADTDDDAVKLLSANSLPAALVLTSKLESTDERVQLDAAKTVLKARKILDSDSQVKVGVQVVLGVPAGVDVTFAPSDKP
jgi:transposase-like protein